jgi:arylesterase/paraoxonase
MRPIFRAVVTAGAIVAVTAIALTVRSLTAFGVFTDVTPGFSGTCKAIATTDGPEDIVIDGDFAFISAFDRRKSNSGDGLYVISLKDPAPHPRKLAGTPGDFHPHGISLFRDSHGQVTLLVINHRSDGRHSIESFAVPPGAPKLVHLGSIESDELTSPNAIAALNAEQFYVTNDHATRSSVGRMLDDDLVLPRANLLFFDGIRFRVVANDLNYPSGAAISPNGQYLYIAEAYNRRLTAYAINPISGRLDEAGNLAIPSNLDNLRFDAKGHLWLGSHPNAIAMAAYRADASKPSPSEIFEVALSDGIPQAATPVYIDKGGQIGGSSVAAVSGDRLLIGSPLDRKILDCRMAR